MSNSNEPEVNVVGDDGYKTQWAKGLIYRREGGKDVLRHDRIRKIVIGMFVLTTVALLFRDDPEMSDKKDETVSTTSSVNGTQPDIEFAAYDAINGAKGPVKKRKRLKIQPLSIVSSSVGSKIPLGTSARAVLLTGGTNGPVKAKLLEDVMFENQTLLPEGTIIWGVGSSTEDRLLVRFTKYVDEDGVSVNIQASAYDNSDSVLGLKGSIIGRTSKKIAAGAGLGLASALHTLQDSENVGGVPVKKPSLENALLSGASSAALGIAEQELEDLKNRQNVVEVPKNSKFLLVFGEI